MRSASARTLGPGFHDQLVSLCLGFAPRVAQEARRLETVVALVAGGFGAALLPVRSEPRGDVVFRPISVDARAAAAGFCWPGGLVTPRRYGIR